MKRLRLEHQPGYKSAFLIDESAGTCRLVRGIELGRAVDAIMAQEEAERARAALEPSYPAPPAIQSAPRQRQQVVGYGGPGVVYEGDAVRWSPLYGDVRVRDAHGLPTNSPDLRQTALRHRGGTHPELEEQ